MPTEGRKKLVVCADDYALTPGVSRAIRELIAGGRISATSVMTVCPYWREEGPALAAVAGTADIGLHLTLTDQTPIGAMPELAPSGRLPPVEALVRASLIGRLPVAEIEVEIERQLEAFVAVWGRQPAHVDGHHHVHQLPGVRGALLRVLGRQNGPRPYLRSCREPLARIMRRGVAQQKAALISTLGAGFTRQASAAGFATNDGFSGIYQFGATDCRLDDLFARFVRDLGARPLAMCHPGYSDTTLAGLDSMTAERDAERVFLAGERWLKVLAAAHVAVVPFAALRPHGA
ncbi:MAG TPA: ChbG/HpnK family deacetylase [Hyphomicrobiaceae bacterium]|nr:ChbG/HpnK family deacetylase [Hyphomicrobiaceae bacterium]